MISPQDKAVAAPTVSLADEIAHELANLMVVIRGHATLLAMAPDGPKRRESIAAIDEASARAAKLSRQLRALTRIERIGERRSAPR